MELDEAMATLRSATADVARALGETDLSSLTREQLLAVVEATHRSGNTLAGAQTVAVAHVAAVEDVVDRDGEWVQQHRGLGHKALDAPELIGPMLGITDQAAATRVEVAIHQMRQTPRLVGQMLSGDVDAWRARVVTSEVEACPEEGATAIVDGLLAHYEGRGGWDETTGPLRARVRRMVARAHPELVAKQAKEACEGRDVRRSAATLGTDHWEAELPVESSALMWQAVEVLARQLRNADQELTLGQARADALAQLVLARADVTVHLHATVPSADATTSAATSTAASTAASGVGNAGPRAPSGASAPSADPVPRPPSADPVPRPPSADPVPRPPSGDPLSRPPAGEPQGSAAEPRPPTGEPRPPTGEPRPAAAEPRLTEVGGLGSTTPTLVDLDALGSSATVVSSTPLQCDPVTGAVVGGVVPASLARRARRDAARRHDRYVVPPDMARLVRLRDGRCRFPSCSINAMYTDQDHVIPWPVGATTPVNLLCLCRRHHRIKQRHGWTVHLDPDGTAHWSDPTGRRSTTHPVDHLDRATVPVAPSWPSGPSAPQPTAPSAGEASAHARVVGDVAAHSEGSTDVQGEEGRDTTNVQGELHAQVDREGSPNLHGRQARSDTHARQASGDAHGRLRALALDEIPSLLEDHLRRHLELAGREGRPTRPTLIWDPVESTPPF